MNCWKIGKIECQRMEEWKNGKIEDRFN